jgi:hypothetical protein
MEDDVTVQHEVVAAGYLVTLVRCLFSGRSLRRVRGGLFVSDGGASADGWIGYRVGGSGD